jgi:hypothetical protein
MSVLGRCACLSRPLAHRLSVPATSGLEHALPGRAIRALNAPLHRPPELDYPFHDRTVTVTTFGRIYFNRQKINLSTVFAGQSVGIKQVSEHIWLVSFMHYDLGYFDHEACRLEPLENPFGPKILGQSQTPMQAAAPAKPLASAPPHSAVASERLRGPQ